MKPGDVPLRAENWDERLRINRPRFTSGMSVRYIAQDADLVIGVDDIGFTGKRAAKSQPHAACGQIKQVGGVNVHVQRRESGRN